MNVTFGSEVGIYREMKCNVRTRQKKRPDFQLLFLARQKHMNAVGCKPTEISPLAVSRMKLTHLTLLFAFDVLAQLWYKNLLRSYTKGNPTFFVCSAGFRVQWRRRRNQWGGVQEDRRMEAVQRGLGCTQPSTITKPKSSLLLVCSFLSFIHVCSRDRQSLYGCTFSKANFYQNAICIIKFFFIK